VPRNLIRERTHAGLTAARAWGRKGGRPKALDPTKRRLAVKLYHERQHTIEEICEMMGSHGPRFITTLKKRTAEVKSTQPLPSRLCMCYTEYV
jgi:Site-specific recombinases, DNA invertase Pin homologs